MIAQKSLDKIMLGLANYLLFAINLERKWKRWCTGIYMYQYIVYFKSTELNSKPLQKRYYELNVYLQCRCRLVCIRERLQIECLCFQNQPTLLKLLYTQKKNICIWINTFWEWYTHVLGYHSTGEHIYTSCPMGIVLFYS